MASAIHTQQIETTAACFPKRIAPAFTPLDQETRPTVGTAAAYYLDRKPQTLHIWACKENGPVRPVRVNGRLAWPVAEIKRALGVEG